MENKNAAQCFGKPQLLTSLSLPLPLHHFFMFIVLE